MQDKRELRDFLERKVLEYNRPSFIALDPVSVPHRFQKKQDIEIAGLFAAIFSWGNRITIIQKSNELMHSMDDEPYDFIMNHRPSDLKRLIDFKHRTFNTTDLLYFIRFLKYHYKQSDTLESAFLPSQAGKKINVQDAESYIKIHNEKKIPHNAGFPGENEFVRNSLSVFYQRFFSLKDAPHRTQKHVASPEKNSTCKRLNMYPALDGARG